MSGFYLLLTSCRWMGTVMVYLPSRNPLVSGCSGCGVGRGVVNWLLKNCLPPSLCTHSTRTLHCQCCQCYCNHPPARTNVATDLSVHCVSYCDLKCLGVHNAAHTGSPIISLFNFLVSNNHNSGRHPVNCIKGPQCEATLSLTLLSVLVE